jgi:hypothetical protein
MDNDRPSLDLRYIDHVCPDKNGTSGHNLMDLGFTKGFFQVPVIAVFTKYDQFKFDTEMKLEDRGLDPSSTLLDAEMERIFQEHYLANLRESVPFVRLESELFLNQLAYITLISVLQE